MDTKVCQNCGKEKSIKSFGAQGLGRNCSPCGKELVLLRKTFRSTTAKPSPYIVCQETWRDFKFCPKCGKLKLLFEFHKNTSSCKDCCKKPSIATKCFRPYLDSETGKYLKRCPICKTVKEIELFSRQKGVPSFCKDCRRIKSREKYNLLSKEEKSALNFKRNNRPSAKAYQIEYRSTEKFKESNRKSYYKNIEKRRAESRRRWHSMTTDERKGYNERTRETRRRCKQAYHARKKNSPFIFPFTKAEIVKRDGAVCYLCDKKLTYKQITLDHILPLSRNGNHKPENIKIACRFCNTQKHNKTLTEYKKYRRDYERFKISASSSNVYL